MSADACIFDKIFSAGVPHIFEEIIFYLDYETFKVCLEVNSMWKELLTSERYISIGRRIFIDGIFLDEKNLWTAAKFHNNDEARRLLASGMVDVNCRNVKNNETFLHVAAWQGNIELAQLLMECTADPNVTDVFGNTPLHQAARKGHKEVTQLLIRSHAGGCCIRIHLWGSGQLSPSGRWIPLENSLPRKEAFTHLFGERCQLHGVL